MPDNLDLSDFFRWLDSTYREQIMLYVKREFPGISLADLDDVWAETRLGLLQKWRSDGGLDVNRGLGRLLQTIARRRACDVFRKQYRQDDKIDVNDELADAELRAAQIRHREWWSNLSPVERQELRITVCEAFKRLAPDEWMVLAVYCENYPSLRRPGQLLAAVMKEFPEVSKKGWTPATVKRLLVRARRSVQLYLKDKEYDLDF
jgi:DNA-directed RNA polymerase specialized sigma24 family protein